MRTGSLCARQLANHEYIFGDRIGNAARQGQGVENAYFLAGGIGEFSRLAHQSDHVNRLQRPLHHVNHVAVAQFGHSSRPPAAAVVKSTLMTVDSARPAAIAGRKPTR